MTPSTPAHVLGCAAGPRCAHVPRGSLACFNAVDCVGDFCWRHEDRLPRELAALRHPATGEPLEVT